ncbi:MAG: sigma-70 family RNA polymerase sigma factor [Deltaproteobacteria bacterium]|nr:sigma-70 family RNA polymerase sigma factor [Deltaproteobacteria bacterium]
MTHRGRVEQLYREWGPLLYRRCLRILGDGSEAEDAVQDVFLKFLERLPRHHERGTTLNLLYRMSTNHCLNLLRRRRLTPGGLPEGHEPPCPQAGPAEVAGRRLALAEILDAADETDRLILYLVAHDGLTQEEAAEIVGISRRAVVKRIAKIRRTGPVEGMGR